MDEKVTSSFWAERENDQVFGYSVFRPRVEDLIYRHPRHQGSAVIESLIPYGRNAKAFVILKPGVMQER